MCPRQLGQDSGVLHMLMPPPGMHFLHVPWLASLLAPGLCSSVTVSLPVWSNTHPFPHPLSLRCSVFSLLCRLTYYRWIYCCIVSLLSFHCRQTVGLATLSPDPGPGLQSRHLVTFVEGINACKLQCCFKKCLPCDRRPIPSPLRGWWESGILLFLSPRGGEQALSLGSW